VSSKVILLKKEFAEVLLHWVAMQIGMKGIKQDARVFDLTSESPLESREAKELFQLNLSNAEELTILFEELMPLNLWMVVVACETTLKDVEQRNDCLDIFHRRFFDLFLRETVDDFDQWMHFLDTKYDEYREAMEKGLYSLACLIKDNLHGEGFPDAVAQFQIALYVEKTLKTLTEALNEYEIVE